MEQTNEALHSLLLAEQEAQSLGQDYINTDHYLLGLVAQAGSSAAQIINSMGVTYKDVRGAAEKLTGCEPGYPAKIPFSQRTGKVMERSDAVAKELNAENMSTKHILIALIDDALEDKEDSRVASVLEGVGIDLAALRHAAVTSSDTESIKPGRHYVIERME